MEMCIQLAMMADCSLEVERLSVCVTRKVAQMRRSWVHHIDHLVKLALSGCSLIACAPSYYVW